jgi:molecular chaperone Hsp33
MSTAAANEDLKANLRRAAKDQLYTVLLDAGRVRGAILHATGIVREAHDRHALGPVETLVLGQALVAGGLLTSTLDAGERLKVVCDCDGPVGGLVVEANSYGEVRGYLRQVPILLADDAGTPPTLRDLFGRGQISVARHRANETSAGPPAIGIVEMQEGTLAQDLAYYFATSEQTPSALNLSVAFDHQGNLEGAGGLFLQAMPGADPVRVAEIEDQLTNLDSIGALFAAGTTPSQLIADAFAAYTPEITSRRRSAFVCHCGHERFLAYIGALGAEEVQDMLEKEDFPVPAKCTYCNTEYHFSRADLQRFVPAGPA